MSEASAKLAELARLEEKAKRIRGELADGVLGRMKEITEGINKLVAEGQALADSNGVQFDLSGLNFLPYGAGGLEYTPEGFKDEWGYSAEEGWSSSSMSC